MWKDVDVAAIWGYWVVTFDSRVVEVAGGAVRAVPELAAESCAGAAAAQANLRMLFVESVILVVGALLFDVSPCREA